VARRGYTFATFLQPYPVAKDLFDTYREASCYADPTEQTQHLAYMALVATAETEGEAERLAGELTWYLKGKAEPQFQNPPGYVSVEQNVRVLTGKAQLRGVGARSGTLQTLREDGVVMYGTPDQVHEQVLRFTERVGGMGHLLMMQQAGFMSHEDTVRSMTLFAREVYPKLKG
jgi:alkanesulfonate monooxygenase SsuD/methylene tetrahydromethanopterin reductase-like flavin-dependent oxidoreductase (luciferase family)